MPWGKWETGLPDDFDLEVSNAYFAFAPKLTGPQGEPRCALHLEGKAEGGSYDTPTQLEGESALLFTVGDKWIPQENGARVMHEAGPAKMFNKKSAIVGLLDGAVASGAPLQDRGNPEEAKIWIGLRLHFNREDVTWKANDGTERTSSVLRVTGYKGAGEAAVDPAAATGATPPSGDDVALIQAGVGGPIYKRLQKLASEAADYDTFASEAVELPKVKDDDGLQDILLDPDRGNAVYEKLKG